MAKITVPSVYDLVAIAEAAGQPDPDKRRYEYGQLHVLDVTQNALDTALSNYSDLARLKRVKRSEILLAFKADYALIWMIDDVSVEEWKDRISFKAAANRTAAENAKLTQAAALFDKLQTKLTYLRDPVRTEAEVSALSWTSTP